MELMSRVSHVMQDEWAVQASIITLAAHQLKSLPF